MLKIAIPKGSLEKGTFSLFEKADLPILRGGERTYNLSINDPRVSEVMMLRPPEIAKFVSNGKFDLGITGQDWIRETSSIVKELADLNFSRESQGKVKIILATNIENPINRPEDIPVNSTVVTEYKVITSEYFSNLLGGNDKRKGRIKIFSSYGATEAKVPRLFDYLVDVTETGRTLKANGMKILATIMTSSTKLIANPESMQDSAKKQAIEEIRDLLLGVIEAQDKVLVKLNVAEENLSNLLDGLPNSRFPTISPLVRTGNQKWFAVEFVTKKSDLNILIPEIRARGAKDILEVDISKMIP